MQRLALALLVTATGVPLAQAEPPLPVATPASVAAGPAAADKPRVKAYAATDDAKVGVLPPGLGIPPGQPAPNAPARDASGREVAVLNVAKGSILLVFYRGGWCPYCNHQMHELAQAFPELQKRGVTPVAVSVDAIEAAARTQAGFEIPFPLLSDPELAVHKAFKVVHHAEAEEVARLKSYGIDIEAASGQQHHDFAVPSIFLIDAARTVRWAHAEGDYKVRPSVAQLLAAIDGLKPALAPAP